MKNAREQRWHTYMYICSRMGRLLSHLFAVHVAYAFVCMPSYACLRVCLRHVLECKCVVANVVCLCLNRPVNTHVECQLFLQWECVTIYVKLKALAVG